MLVVLRLFSLLVLFLSGSALAGEGDWQVAKTSQQVAYTVDKQKWTPVRAGDVVPNNAWISTGPRGRAQLVRGVESISFQPNTLAGIFTRNEGDRKTNVYQQTGVLDLEIEKRSRPHTSVQTPFLAAVVKGTNFRVSVEKQQARVSVNRGLVQVTSFSSGQRSQVGARQSATVDTARGMSVAGDVSAPSIERVAPSAPSVQAATPSAANPAAANDAAAAAKEKNGFANSQTTTSSKEKDDSNGNSGKSSSGKTSKSSNEHSTSSSRSSSSSGSGHSSGEKGSSSDSKSDGHSYKTSVSFSSNGLSLGASVGLGNGYGNSEDSGNGNSEDNGNGNGNSGGNGNGNGNDDSDDDD